MYRGILRVIGFDKIQVIRPRQMSGNSDFHLPTKASESAINSPIDLKNWCVPDGENVDMIHGRLPRHSTLWSARALLGPPLIGYSGIPHMRSCHPAHSIETLHGRLTTLSGRNTEGVSSKIASCRARTSRSTSTGTAKRKASVQLKINNTKKSPKACVATENAAMLATRKLKRPKES